ncbi:MAG: hypothetical protein H9W81_07875 [Enterococcus sp.]|nr:hypothetical protein [Enterococcus sp.]
MSKYYFLAGIAFGALIFLVAMIIPWGDVEFSTSSRETDISAVTLTCNVTGITVNHTKYRSTSFIETDDCGKLPASAEAFFGVEVGHQYELTTGEGPSQRYVIHSASLVK